MPCAFLIERWWVMDDEIRDILMEISARIDYLDLKLDRLAERMDILDLNCRKSAKEIIVKLINLIDSLPD